MSSFSEEDYSWAQKAFEDFEYPIDKFLNNGHGTPKERYELLRNRTYDTILALYNHRHELFKFILHDPRFLMKEHWNQKLLSCICVCDFFEELKFITEHPDYDPAVNHNEPIYTASFHYKGRHRCLEFLLNDPRVNPADKNHRALIIATCNDNVIAVKLLVAAYQQRKIPFSDDLVQTLRNIAAGSDYHFDFKTFGEIYSSGMKRQFHKGERNEELITLFEQTF